MTAWRKYHKAMCQRIAAALDARMGGCCAWHDMQDEHGECEGPLERHHPNGRDYKPRKLSWRQRLRRYEQDFAEGNLILLCERHHKIADAIRADYIRTGPHTSVDIPF